MSRRSVTNERYKKDNIGTTRKSGASVKPKREAGESSPSPKPKAKKGPSRTPAKKTASVRVPDSPEIKRLRKYWWGFMGAALIIAMLLLPLSKDPALNKQWGGLAVGVYTVALGGALYLEFGPIRKARAAAVAAAKKVEKSGKPKGGGKPAATSSPVVAVTSGSMWKPAWWPFGKSGGSHGDVAAASVKVDTSKPGGAGTPTKPGDGDGPADA